MTMHILIALDVERVRGSNIVSFIHSLTMLKTCAIIMSDNHFKEVISL